MLYYYFDDVPMVEFVCLVLARMPSESYRRRYMLCLCDVFRALINCVDSIGD